MKETHLDNPFKKPFSTLQELADSVKEVLDCPATIEDANHRLLAYSSHEDTTDSARIGTIMSQRVPEKVINRLWKERIIPKLMNMDAALRIPEIAEIGLRDRVAIAIRRNTEVLGYIWALEKNDRLSDEELALLKDAAAAALPLLLKLHRKRKEKEENYQDFFWQLLTGQFKSGEDIQKKFAQLHLKMPARYAVLVFQFEEEISRKIEENISYLITTSQKITNHFMVVMRNEVILIASPHPTQPDEKVFNDFISFFISAMNNRFAVNGIKGSSGTVYKDFEKAETSYQEALKVLQLRAYFPDDLAEATHYHQLGIFKYFDAIIEEKRSSHYEHPAIALLEQYDKHNKTNLLASLEIFIQQDSNVHEAAKKMFIHTNTMSYRLKRIAEISQLNLKSTHEKMAVFLDLKIRQWEKQNRL